MIKKLLLSLLVSLGLMVGFSGQVFAGTDLTVTCANQGPCDISPSGTPLFDESNLLPGDTVSQTMTITNNDSDDTCNLVLEATDTTSGQTVNLAERMFAAIHTGATNYFGAASGGEALDGTTYQDLFDVAGPLSLGSLAPGATQDFTWLGTFDPSAGNEYQNTETVFDIGVDITCDGGEGGDGPSNPGVLGASFSAPGPADPPVCNATAPTSAPNLTITNVGVNTVSLSWTPVSPVTHYALSFTRVSDGAQYGSSNIGNVTSFTVTNLSGGDSYNFEVFGVNDCAPGPRSTLANTGGVPGPFIAGQPVGGGQTLGVTTDEATPSGDVASGGDIAGLTDETCAVWKSYLPWVLLVVQAVFIMAMEFFFRRDRGWTKHFLAVALTLASIGIFYFFRECDCFASDDFSLALLLCEWYFIASLALSGILKLVSYAFLEEVEDKVK